MESNILMFNYIQYDLHDTVFPRLLKMVKKISFIIPLKSWSPQPHGHWTIF